MDEQAQPNPANRKQVLARFMASTEEAINRQLKLADSIEQDEPVRAQQLRIRAQRTAKDALEVWDWMQYLQ